MAAEPAIAQAGRDPVKALDTRFYTGHNVYAATTVAFQQFELEQSELDSLAGLG